MPVNYGKEFEKRFEQDWSNSFPDNLILRLYDQMSKYKTVSENPCDYISFINDHVLLLECKETQSSTLNFAKIPQLDRLLKLSSRYKHVLGWVVIWFFKFDRIIMISDTELDRIRFDGHKSVGVELLNSGVYKYIEVPSKKKTRYLTCDFSSILDEIIED